MGVQIPVRDSDGSAIIRPKTTKTGWHYEPRIIDFTTGKYNTLYNRKHDGNGIDDGTDFNDATLKFYDGSGAELSYQQTGYESETEAAFQARLDAGCIRTEVDWNPTYDYDIIGGIMVVKNIPTRAYMWAVVAPDIPENLGGQVPFIAGGWALHMFTEGGVRHVDGRGAKSITYDPVYGTSKIRIIIKHGLADFISVECTYEHFKA